MGTPPSAARVLAVLAAWTLSPATAFALTGGDINVFTSLACFSLPPSINALKSIPSSNPPGQALVTRNHVLWLDRSCLVVRAPFPSQIEKSDALKLAREGASCVRNPTQPVCAPPGKNSSITEMAAAPAAVRTGRLPGPAPATAPSGPTGDKYRIPAVRNAAKKAAEILATTPQMSQ